MALGISVIRFWAVVLNHYQIEKSNIVHTFTFSTFATDSLCGVAGQVLQRPFHLSLSVAYSSLMFRAFRSLITVSFNHNVGLPLSLGRFPSIFISTPAPDVFYSSRLLTFPITCIRCSENILYFGIATSFSQYTICIMLHAYNASDRFALLCRVS